MKDRVYIAGPITGTTDYMERFAEAEKELKAQDYDVINPARVCAQLPELPYQDYIKIGLSLLEICTTIYLLPGLEKSKGAILEWKYAEAMGKNIIFAEKIEEPCKPYDSVDNPAHYVAGRKHEPKDVIHDWGLNFNLGCAVKYISRAGRKGAVIEDLKKAQKYLQFEIDALES